MANGFPHVQPGDLITSAQWNGLVDGLNDALTRIAQLEGATGGGGSQGPVLFGDFDVVWLGVSPLTVLPDQPVTFQFRVGSRASGEADVLIDPLISVAAAQSTWQSRLQVLNAALQPLPSRRLHLAPSQEAVVNVRISSVPSGTAGTDFELTVNASAGGVLGTSGALPFQVGQATDPPDASITLNPTGVIGAGTLAGDTLTLPSGVTTRVRFLASFQQVGSYDLTLIPSGQGWTVQRFLATPATYQITAGDIGAGGVATRFPEITVQAAANAAANASVQVRYQRQGAAGSRSFALNLALGA